MLSQEDNIKYNKMNYPQNILDRFWSRVAIPFDYEDHPEKCWEWNSNFFRFYLTPKKYISIHQFVFQSINGIHSSRIKIHNSCNNKKCVNPDHLYTFKDTNKAIARFWPNVEVKSQNDCWVWKGTKTSGGYGLFCYLGKQVLATRFIQEIINSQDLSNGLIVCHKCDNPSCCNPDHLFVGTPEDNSKDMVQKGRSVCGEKSKNTLLTNEIVKDMLNKIWIGELQSAQEAANYIKTTPSQILRILNRITWKNVTELSEIPLEDIKNKIIRKRTFIDQEMHNNISDCLSEGFTIQEVSEMSGICFESVRQIKLQLTV